MKTRTSKEKHELRWGLTGAVPITLFFAILPYSVKPTQSESPSRVNEQKIKIRDFTRDAQKEKVYVQPDQTFQAADYTRGRTQTLDTIVVHTTEGSAEGAIHHLTSPKPPEVSAHYVVTKAGEIVQLVDPKDTAYHVRGWNARSIGIEFEGTYVQPLTQQQLKEGAKLIFSLQQNYGVLQIKPHAELDPSRRKDPGESNYRAIVEAVKKYQPNR